MAKVYIVNGVRCVPEVSKVPTDKVQRIIDNARVSAAERAELTRTILSIKANDILKSI